MVGYDTIITYWNYNEIKLTLKIVDIKKDARLISMIQ